MCRKIATVPSTTPLTLLKQCKSWLIFRSQVEQFGEGADHTGNLFHAWSELIVGARLEVVGHDFVHQGQHVTELHRRTVLTEHPDQCLDEPGPIDVVTPREVTCRSRSQITGSRSSRSYKTRSMKVIRHSKLGQNYTSAPVSGRTSIESPCEIACTSKWHSQGHSQLGQECIKQGQVACKLAHEDTLHKQLNTQ